MPPFAEKLRQASQTNRSLLCVGLDPDPARMPIRDVGEFNAGVVRATADLVCAYKPNFPFYEALGVEGLRALERTVEVVRAAAPKAVLIADGKRGDIGSTNEMYAKALFETWDFDAATVNAWGGSDSMEPFLAYREKGVIVWCRSSNPGAAEFQDAIIERGGERMPMYEWMAVKAAEWNASAGGNVGIVAGATYADDLRRVRERCAGMPMLVPGVGAQGGDLRAAVRFGLDDGDDAPNLMINSSRGIIYASSDRAHFGRGARTAAQFVINSINRVLAEEGRAWRD